MSKIPYILESVLGKGYTKDNNQFQYYCPFCNHHKKKLNINIEKNLYHCWVCNVKGRSLINLFQRLNVPNSKILELKTELKDNNFYININENIKSTSLLFLPSEYKPFDDNTLKNPFFLNAYNYLIKKRNLTDEKIKKYDIGFCDSGLYNNRIVIPSYDALGNLNYFITRSIYDSNKMKYLNPENNKDFFPFELYTSFHFPIIFVEGVFDMINIDFNAVPLLGNTVSDYIIDELLNHEVDSVYLFLDGDAKKFLYRNCKKFIQYNINPIIIFPPGEKDPGEITEEEINNAFKNKMYINEENLDSLKQYMEFEYDS